MLKKIIVPHDGSKAADKATGFASELAISIASSAPVEIILVNVVPEIPAYPLLLDRPVRTSTTEVISFSLYARRLYEEMRLHAADMLDQKKQEIESKLDAASRHNITLRTAVVIGDSVSAKLLELAENEKADLVIIGSIGLSGLSKLKTLGSTSRAVSERASCPVTIVH